MNLLEITIVLLYFGAITVIAIMISIARKNLKRYDCEHRFTFDDGNKKRCLDCKKKLKNRL